MNDYTNQDINFDIKLIRLELDHFRLFSTLDLSFNNQMNLFIGKNGSGKSTILDITAVILRKFLSETFYPDNFSNKELKGQDVNNGSTTTLCYLTLEIACPIKVKDQEGWETMEGGWETMEEGWETMEEELNEQKQKDWQRMEEGWLGIKEGWDTIEEKLNNQKQEDWQRIEEEWRAMKEGWLIIREELETMKKELNEQKQEDWQRIEEGWDTIEEGWSRIREGYKWKPENEEVKIGLSINKYSGEISYIMSPLTSLKEAISYYRDGDSLPILIYLGGNTLGTNFSALEGRRNRYTTLDSIYSNALTPNRFSFKQFFDWYDNEIKKTINFENNTIDKSQTPNLQFVEKAVINVLNQDSQDEYSNLKMKYSSSGDTIVIDKKSNDFQETIELSQLSAGEKNMLALVADISRRLVEANPSLENPLEGNGIILIDEIDLHLHPKWQQGIVKSLEELFPKIQFVITTHSPLILGNASSDDIRLLDNQSDYDVRETYGREANYILSVIMDGMSSAFEKEFETVSNLIASDKIDDADEKLKEIIKEIEHKENNSGNYPEVIIYQNIIKRKRRNL